MKPRWCGTVAVSLAVFALACPALAQQVVISGSVRTPAGVPVPGVQMTGLPGGAMTDSGGFYSARVTAGWSGTVTPVHPCYSMSPTSTAYTQVGANQSTSYVATALTTTISGFVKTPGGSPISGAVLNGLPGPVTTDSMGFYAARVSCGWSGTAAPALAGYTFFPALLAFNGISASQSNQNFTGTGAGQVTVSGYVTTIGGKPIPGVTINGLPGPPITDFSGFYTTKVSTDWSGIATPALTGYTFVPSSLTFMHLSADTPNQNFTGTPSAPPAVAASAHDPLRVRR